MAFETHRNELEGKKVHPNKMHFKPNQILYNDDKPHDDL